MNERRTLLGKKLWLWLALVLAVLFALLLVLLYSLPGLGLLAASRWYAQQGEGYALSAQNWQFAPFKTRLELTGVELQHPGVGSGSTAFNRLVLQLRPGELFNRWLLVERIELDGLQGQLHLSEQDGTQQVQLAGLSFPLTAAAGEAAVESTTDMPSSSASETSVPWRLALQQLQFSDVQWHWDIALAEGHTQGHVALQTLQLGGFDSITGNDGAAAQQRLDNLQLDGLLIDAGGQRPALQLQQLALQGLQNNGQTQALQTLQLQGLQMGAAEQPLLRLQHYQLEDMQWQAGAAPDAEASEQRLSVGAQHYSGLELAIRRDADGQLLGLPVASPETADATTTEQSVTPHEETVAASPAHTLLTLMLAGLAQAMPDNADDEQPSGSTIVLEDRSVNPPLQTTISLQELQVGALNGQQNAQGFSLTEPVSLHLLLGLDRFNRITLDAELGLFQRDNQLYPQGPIQLTVRQLDLVPFNGYLAAAMGYQVERGTLDVDADIRIDKAQLQGEIKLLLRNSRFVPVDEATIARVSKQISMPVETALDLLRDDNGNIRLTIPVRGDLSNPDVGLGDITRQLSRLALQQGALYYLRQSLQPYSAMLSIASYAGDYLFAIRLDSLSFADNRSDLTDEHQQHLQKLIGVMRDKQRIEVQACPFVSAAEAAALGDNWPQLARARGDNVKAAIAALDTQVAERISVCRPQQGERAEVMLGVNG